MSKIRAIVSNAQPILFIIVLILCTVFLLQNTSTIQVNFLVLETQIPTIILILVASLFGFFGGYLFAIRLRRTQKKDSLVRE
ncbi:lipopolysaccharide assembly protein LapA domain-containing protein [Chloroflexota bacterium]